MLLKYKSPIGIIYCLFKGSELIEISIGEKPFYVDTLPQTITFLKGSFKGELDAYFNGHLNKFNQKIKFVTGTDFEHKVWLALKEIPYGETRSYKWISEKVGRPKAVRAVGQALKKNPMPIILPCHRVIASDGSIGGFSCGVEIKGWLLRHEGAYGKRGMSIQ
ncbi:MAG: methylated-DNA--[protein]-cysteine S-methyltransferase [Nitrospirota bacterium]